MEKITSTNQFRCEITDSDKNIEILPFMFTVQTAANDWWWSTKLHSQHQQRLHDSPPACYGSLDTDQSPASKWTYCQQRQSNHDVIVTWP